MKRKAMMSIFPNSLFAVISAIFLLRVSVAKALTERCRSDTASLFDENPNLALAFDRLALETAEYFNIYRCDPDAPPLVSDCTTNVTRYIEAVEPFKGACASADGAKLHDLNGILTCPTSIATDIIRYVRVPDCVASSCTEEDLDGAITPQLEAAAMLHQEIFESINGADIECSLEFSIDGSTPVDDLLSQQAGSQPDEDLLSQSDASASNGSFALSFLFGSMFVILTFENV